MNDDRIGAAVDRAAFLDPVGEFADPVIVPDAPIEAHCIRLPKSPFISALSAVKVGPFMLAPSSFKLEVKLPSPPKMVKSL